MKISYKLIIYLVALLSCLGLTCKLAIQHVEQQLLEQTESALENTHRLETARIDHVLESYARDARSLSANTYLEAFLRYIHNYNLAKETGVLLSDIARSTLTVGAEETQYGSFSVNINDALPLQDLAYRLRREAGLTGTAIQELRIIDREGNNLGQTPGFSWKSHNLDIVTKAMRQANTLYSDAYSTEDDQPRIGVVSPVIDDRGEIIGALLVEISLGTIIELVEHHEDFGISKEAYLAQQDHLGNAQIISTLRFDRDSAFEKTLPASLSLPIHQAFSTNQEMVTVANDYRGVHSILAIGLIESTNWGLVLKVDTSEAFQAIDKLRKMAGNFILITIGVSILAYMVFLQPIANRLKRTSYAAKKIMQGDLTTRLLDKSNDEIGHLARTIDSLAHDLGIDKMERAKIETQLRHQAMHDGLTGLYNRKYADQTLKRLGQDSRYQHTIVFLDLNGFKQINDHYGHTIGDEVLITVSSRLETEIEKKPDFTLARWGGDEFVIIAPQLNTLQAKNFCKNLANVFNDPVTTSAGDYLLSCSIGYATTDEQKHLTDALVEADANMYAAKRQRVEEGASQLRHFA